MTKKTPKTKKRKRALTQRQRKFAEGLARDLPIKTAALEAGYSLETAIATAYKMSDKNQIQEAVEDIRERNRRLLDSAGLGEAKRFKKLAQLTEAQKVISAVVLQPGESTSAGGKTTDFIEVPDNTTQLNALKEAHKLAGDYPADKHEVSHVITYEDMLLAARRGPADDAIDITPEDNE